MKKILVGMSLLLSILFITGCSDSPQSVAEAMYEAQTDKDVQMEDIDALNKRFLALTKEEQKESKKILHKLEEQK